MKTLITTFILFLLAITLNAQKTNLVVFTESGEKFVLHLNGVQQNAVSQSNVKVQGLEANAVQALIIFDEAIPQLKQLVALEPDQEMTFVVKKNNNGKYVFRLISNVAIAQAPASTATVSNTAEPVASPRESRPSITTVPASASTTSVESNSTSVKINVLSGENSANASVNIQVEAPANAVAAQPAVMTDIQQSSSIRSSTTEAQPEAKSRPQQKSNASTKSKDCASMLAADFERAKKSIEAKSFSEEQMTVCKQVVNANCFTVRQVISLMEIFTYEENKLTLAKWAYSKTVNKGDYYLVNDAFSYSASVQDLDEFIESQK